MEHVEHVVVFFEAVDQFDDLFHVGVADFFGLVGYPFQTRAGGFDAFVFQCFLQRFVFDFALLDALTTNRCIWNCFAVCSAKKESR